LRRSLSSGRPLQVRPVGTFALRAIVSEPMNKQGLAVPPINDSEKSSQSEAWERRFAALPLASYGAGETVFAEGTKTGRLLILKTGAVSIVKGGTEIATVSEPGAILGELSALLDQPHTADVRALEPSQFHVADAAALLTQDPIAPLYIGALLARRLDAANRALVELKNQLQTGQPASVIEKTVQKIEELLSAGGASLVYAGYPTDPFA
jgi:CRP/FNR family cyclic AMP-dependent transcriptional regulator